MKIKNLVLAAAAGLVMVACGGGVDTKDPKAVTEGFVNALNGKDWDGAKALATEKSGEMIDGMASMVELAAMGGKEEEPKKLEKVECGEEADEACDCTAFMEGGEETPYHLVKDGENWKVDFNKGLGGDMDMGSEME